MQKGTIGAAKIGASMALLLAAVLAFSVYIILPALAALDDTVNTIILRTPANNTYISNINGNITLNASLTGANVSDNATFYYLNNSVYTYIGLNQTAGPSNFTFTFNTTFLKDGVYSFFVNATNATANTTNTTNGNITVDNTAPVLNFLAPANASYIYGNANEIFQINITENNLNPSANATLYYMQSGAPEWIQLTLKCYDKAGSASLAAGSPYKCNTTVNVNYGEGKTIYYLFNTTDLSGNNGANGTESAKLSVITDRSQPAPSNQGTNDTDNIIPVGYGINLTVSWTDNYGLFNATLSINETGTWRNVTNAYGSPMTLSGTSGWSNFTWSNSSTPAGTVVQWKIYMNDHVQPTRNENVSLQGEFTIDGTAPQNATQTAFSKANGTKYDTNNNYMFEVNWTDAIGMDKVILQLGRPGTGLYTNYTDATTPAISNTGDNYSVVFSQVALGPVGTYNITWYANDTSNNMNTMDTIGYTIVQAATEVSLWLNGTAGNRLYQVSEPYNFTALVNVSGKTVGIDTNITGWVIKTDTDSGVENESTMPTTPAIYNITGYFNANPNYTASFRTYYATVSGWMSTVVTVNDSYIKTGDGINVGCALNDSNSSAVAMEGYTVELYNGTQLISTGQTNSAGIYNYSFAASVEGQAITLKCAVYNNYTTLYNTSKNGTTTYNMDVTPPILNNPTPANGNYIIGGSTELFQVNITETNFDSSKNVTLLIYNLSTWYSYLMTCYDAAGTKALSSGPYMCNKTLNLYTGDWPNGANVRYYFNTTDLAGNPGNNGTSTAWLNATIARTKPQFIGNASSPDTYQNYSTSANYGFQINWTSGSGIDKVIFQLGRPGGALINYTASLAGGFANTYIYNFTQAAFGPSGIYNITWFANDTAGNANATQTWNYQIYNATNVLNLYLINSTAEYANQNIVITYGNFVTLNASATTGTISLYRNASLSNTATAPAGNATETVTLGAGVWEINASVVSNNANYSDNTTNITYYVTVNKASPTNFLNLQINGTDADSIRAYPNITNVTGWANMTGQSDLGFVLFRNGANMTINNTAADYNRTETIRLGVGNYTYIYNTTGNANYTSGSITRVLNITNGTATITMTALSWNNVYPNATTVTCSVSSQENEAPATLYRNASNVNNTDNDISISYLAVGAYSYVCGAGQTENYTASNSSANNLIITKGSTVISLMLNSSQASRSYNINDVANFTANLSVAGKNLTIYSNISAGWVLAGTDSSSQLYNTTTLATKGVYNITANFAGDENYTAIAQTYYATVNDVGVPTYTGNATSLANGSAYSTSANYGFQINWADDVAVFNATFQLGRPDGTPINYTNSSGSTPAVRLTGSTYHINFTQDQLGPAGNYNITWFANDTSNNWNRTDVVGYIIVPAATNTTLWINSVAANTTNIEQGNNVNLTATLNITNTVYIYANLTGWVLLSNSTGTLTNTTSSSGVTPRNYSNITAYFIGNENYSASSQHFHINITADTTGPTILLYNSTSQPFLNASVTKKSFLKFAVNASVSDTGVGISGQTCKAYVNGTESGSGTESGGFCNMTVTMPAGGNGNVTLNITINDTNGNLGTNASFVVQMDNSAPVLTINNPQSGQYIKGTIWVNGTVYDNIAMGAANITVNNATFSISPYGNFGGANNSVFNISNVSVPADGYYLLNIGYTDMAGNDGNTTIAFYMDNTVPTNILGLTSGTKAKSSNQNIQVNVTDNLMTNSSITLHYYRYGHDTSWQTTTMTGTPGMTTTYSVTINTDVLGITQVGYFVTGVDNATNPLSSTNGSATSPLGNFTIGDVSVPLQPTGLSAVQVGVTRQVNITWTASVSTDVTGYYIYRDTGVVTTASANLGDAGNTTRFTDTVPADGTWNYTVIAHDAVPNTNTTIIENAIVTVTTTDTTAPVNPSSVSVAQIGNTRGINITWTASASTDAVKYNIYYKLGGAVTTSDNSVQVGNVTKTSITVAQDGNWNFTVTAVDSSNNMNTTIAISANVTVDTEPDETAPSISFTAPTNSTNVTTTTPTITFVVTDNSNIQLNTISVTGVSGFSAAKNCTGNQLEYSCSFKPTALTNGVNYTITATAKDGANLSATSSIIVGVDTTKGVTASMISSDTSGVADNTYANGWSYTFNITLGTGVNATRVKLNNFTMTTDSTKTIGVPGNVVMNYTNASGYAKSYNVLESYNESATIDPLFDLDSSAAGVQGNVTIYVKIPSGTVAGAYSTSYAFGSYTV